MVHGEQDLLPANEQARVKVCGLTATLWVLLALVGGAFPLRPA